MPGPLENLARLPMRSKLAIAGAALAILLVAVMMLRLATAPSYSTIMSGLDPAETGEITAVLDERGIPYELQGNGTALAVQKAQAAQARVALAGQGFAAGGGEQGFELFDEQKLGASDFQQRITYQRALEGEIGRTINEVQGVSGAQVQLVLPEDDLFADTSTPATAAVMLAGPADALEPGAVRGIAQLVASSVKDLKPDNVTITDGAGQLLWPQGDAMGGGGAGGSTKQSMEESYERRLEAGLGALLARTLGPDKAQVQIKADLNVDKVTRNELTYARRGTPLREQTETEQLEGGAARARGAAGTAGNVPTYSAAGGAGGGASNYERESTTTDYGVDKTVAKTEVAPGTVNRLQVALLVDKSVPPAVVDGLRDTVASAAGVDEERGDPPVQVAQLPFVKIPEAKAGPLPMSLLGPLKWVGLGLAVLLFLFLTARHLRKREGEAIAEPAWLTQFEQPVPLSQLERGTDASPTASLTLPERQRERGMQALDQLVEREPERVAAQVRQWMSEE